MREHSHSGILNFGGLRSRVIITIIILHWEITSMTKDELIEELIADGYLKTPAIIAAFRKIDRAAFVPEELRVSAYTNIALPIGGGQTISQPLVVAFMLELLKPKAGDNILDIGTGSGWVAALLAELVGPGGRVTTIERISELSATARQNCAKYGFERNGRLAFMVGDGMEGYPPRAPYDCITAAAAGEAIPGAWKTQLGIGGRLVAPVGSHIVCIEKAGAQEFREQSFGGFAFVPLVKE